MKVFVAGPRAISNLNGKVKERLTNIINNNFTNLVGDADGADKQIQKLCYSLNYKNVRVFASNGKVRNNIGQWEVEKVEVADNIRGFDFYAAKDLEMAKNADYGFMIWNGKSKGTLNNMGNLVKLHKKVLVYLTPDKQFYTICSSGDIKKLISNEADTVTGAKFDNTFKNNEQLSLFN